MRNQTIAWAILLSFAALITLPVDGDARPPRRRAKAKTGTVTIFSLNRGAVVEINNKPAGTIPLEGPLKLPAGTYSVHVHKRGHTDFDETITVVAGKTIDVEAELIPFAGIVNIQCNIPGATVAVDGKLTGTIPFDKDIPAGNREITVQAKDHLPFKQSVIIIPGQPLQLNIFLKRITAIDLQSADDDSIVKQWWFWTIVGVAVAGGAAAAIAVPLATQSPPLGQDMGGQVVFRF